ncbi:MAG: glycoside hydrolase family 88 protein [Lachnospiraceae bacterium]|nr:glycoside hydrolase family 88 protein [Lachnospiraceae bacterium]
MEDFVEAYGNGVLHEALKNKLDLLFTSFQKVLYEEDDIFLKGMATKNLAGDDVNKYRFWEWTQGVGLFGMWKMFERTKDKKYLDVLIAYYERQFGIGFPAKNVNTTAPMLTLAYVYEYTKNEKYKELCLGWCEWLMNGLPKTKEGGFQHMTSDTLNDQELWDDTLFMAVLFLAKCGVIFGKTEWVEEAKYQFLLHIKYLSDKETGLWFHGWTFNGRHNFAKALWGRGNSWATAAVPEFLSIIDCEPCVKRFLVENLKNQVASLKKFQDPTGMWHTLVDDPTSYVETSATCGFAYGILKGVHDGLIGKEYEECAIKALKPVLSYINDEGIVNQVSYGTAMGRETKQFYKEIEIRPMPYGQAMAILFLLEALQ